MDLTERQQAMLQAMGVRVWQRPAVPDQAVLQPSPAQPVAAQPPTAAVPAAPARPPVTPAAAAVAAPRVPDDERAQAIARMGWAELREAAAGCQACGLCAQRTHSVFGVGHPQARLMIIGEAPGEQEDLKGEPFVGAAGQLLDRMLLAVGLTRTDASPEQQVYIANTLKCRPPRNRNPEPDELARCEPFLRRQIALVQPRLILAMGRFAVQALLGTPEAIGRLRGNVHMHGDVPVVVTYHPAYLLRNPADKSRSWADLCLAAAVLDERMAH